MSYILHIIYSATQKNGGVIGEIYNAVGRMRSNPMMTQVILVAIVIGIMGAIIRYIQGRLDLRMYIIRIVVVFGLLLAYEPITKAIGNTTYKIASKLDHLEGSRAYSDWSTLFQIFNVGDFKITWRTWWKIFTGAFSALWGAIGASLLKIGMLAFNFFIIMAQTVLLFAGPIAIAVSLIPHCENALVGFFREFTLFNVVPIFYIFTLQGVYYLMDGLKKAATELGAGAGAGLGLTAFALSIAFLFILPSLIKMTHILVGEAISGALTMAATGMMMTATQAGMRMATMAATAGTGGIAAGAVAGAGAIAGAITGLAKGLGGGSFAQGFMSAFKPMAGVAKGVAGFGLKTAGRGLWGMAQHAGFAPFYQAPPSWLGGPKPNQQNQQRGI